MNLSQEPIDLAIQLAKTASKRSYSTRKTISCFVETIGCLYQQTTKTEFKELEIERLYTVVYIGSLQTRATSSLLRNPEDIH